MPIFVWIDANMPFLWLATAGLLLMLCAWLIVLQVRFGRLRRRYLALMQGGDGKSIEQALDAYLARAQETSRRVDELASRAGQLEQTIQLAVQHVALLRFDAFDDVGGKQSFAAALADARGDGFVISSMAARQATRVYAKPLQGWEAEYTLTDEEKQAIARARG